MAAALWGPWDARCGTDGVWVTLRWVHGDTSERVCAGQHCSLQNLLWEQPGPRRQGMLHRPGATHPWWPWGPCMSQPSPPVPCRPAACDVFHGAKGREGSSRRCQGPKSPCGSPRLEGTARPPRPAPLHPVPLGVPVPPRPLPVPLSPGHPKANLGRRQAPNSLYSSQDSFTKKPSRKGVHPSYSAL